ncbi:hypothetical protein [Embleya sp. NBC_00896]|uniref:hypothetical protein n=1 Tax=Embleya sp. NBC_00896 TaxID=2975961 RepID=UPI003864BEAF|nr:hypothetical protein OG928_02130 [Embleya sp. NBC_00896]
MSPMSRRSPVLCDACAHFRQRVNGDSRTTADRYIAYCSAFSEAIPRSISPGGYDHRRPYPGDNGIMFEMKDGKEKILALYEKITPEDRRNRVAPDATEAVE